MDRLWLREHRAGWVTRQGTGCLCSFWKSCPRSCQTVFPALQEHLSAGNRGNLGRGPQIAAQTTLEIWLSALEFSDTYAYIPKECGKHTESWVSQPHVGWGVDSQTARGALWAWGKAGSSFPLLICLFLAELAELGLRSRGALSLVGVRGLLLAALLSWSVGSRLTDFSCCGSWL